MTQLFDTILLKKANKHYTVHSLQDAGYSIVEAPSPAQVVMQDSDGNYSRWRVQTFKGRLTGYTHVGDLPNNYHPGHWVERQIQTGLVTTVQTCPALRSSAHTKTLYACKRCPYHVCCDSITVWCAAYTPTTREEKQNANAI